jgi:RNA polymerase sigma factor (sigma-70 family)
MPPLRPIDRWFLSQVLPHEGRFLSVARRLLRDSDEARDLVQEVFTRLFVMEGWATIANPRAYVVRMLRNLAIERIRRSRIIEFQRLADVESLNFVDEAPDPFRATDARDQVQRMWALLEKMPPEYRSVLIQRRLDDRPISELAREMGISASTLEKRLGRAIHLLNVGMLAHETTAGDGVSVSPTRPNCAAGG